MTLPGISQETLKQFSEWYIIEFHREPKLPEVGCEYGRFETLDRLTDQSMLSAFIAGKSAQ